MEKLDEKPGFRLGCLHGHALRTSCFVAAPAAAGSTAAGKPVVFDEVPWFWSDQHQANLQVLGSFARVTQVLRRPGTGENGFVLLGLDGGDRLVGAICVDSGREMSVLKRVLATRSPLDSAAAADAGVPLRDILAACQALSQPPLLPPRDQRAHFTAKQ